MQTRADRPIGSGGEAAHVASRQQAPRRPWSPDDYDVMEEGRAIGPHLQGRSRARGSPVDNYRS
jgi:hypothetical protein